MRFAEKRADELSPGDWIAGHGRVLVVDRMAREGSVKVVRWVSDDLTEIVFYPPDKPIVVRVDKGGSSS